MTPGPGRRPSAPVDHRPLAQGAGGRGAGGDQPRTTAPRHPRYPVTREIDEQTRLGEVYVRSLVRAPVPARPCSCCSALGCRRARAAAAAVPAGPRLLRSACSGVPLPWLLLGRSRSTRCSCAGCLLVRPAGGAQRTRLRRVAWTGRVDHRAGRCRMSTPYGVTAVVLVAVARPRCWSAPSACGCRGRPRTSTSPPARSRPLLERLRDRRRVPVGRVLPGRRRPGARLRRRHAVATRSATRPATWCCWCWSPRRCAARARTPCPTSPRSAWTPGGAPGRGRAGRGDRLAVPGPAVPGRGPDPADRHRRPALGRAACWSAAVVGVNVVAGGMRSITFVQAFQYWLKLTALAVPRSSWCWSGGAAGSTAG